jgi:hypothetical protein
MACSDEHDREHEICGSEGGEYTYMKCCLVGLEKPITFWREYVSVLECEAAQFGGLPTFRMYLRNDESTRFLFWHVAL